MRGRTLITLSNRDGRSLARALIVLLLLNLFIGGLANGTLAASADLAQPICSIGGNGGGVPHGPQPVRDDCCPAGCPAGCCAAMAEPVSPDLAFTAVRLSARRGAAVSGMSPKPRDPGLHGPRGPPVGV